MRAVLVEHFGPPSELQVRDVARPKAGPGEVVVEVHAAAIHPSDVRAIQGLMAGTTLPRIPGRDFAGVVVEGPPELVGQEVWGAGGDFGFERDGTHAEYLLLPQAAVRPKPANLSMEEAAAIGATFVTAWAGLVDAAHLAQGETVAIIGANGTVGVAALQIAAWLGAKVVGIARRELRDPIVKQLNIPIIVYKNLYEMKQSVLEATNGEGADVVFDTVGGVMFEPGLGLLKERGRQTVISSIGQSRVSFDLSDFYQNELRLLGVDTRKLRAEECATILDKLAPGIVSGALHSTVATSYPLEEARSAYERVQLGNTHGRVILQPFKGK